MIAEPPRAHDPVIAKDGDTYYLFSTGHGIPIHISTDRRRWQRAGRVFEQPPAWATQTIPGFKDHIWAPDISYFNGKWHLYYTISTFGSNRSAIGLATNITLDATRPDYRWQDQGLVVQSKPGDDWNAIDANFVQDEHGKPWLSFGSFWSGIKLIELDPATGKPVDDAPLHALASRPDVAGVGRAIEAPFIVWRNGFYYLFVSFDLCCRGVDSTYNIRVGRAQQITGPYADREGIPMLEGGGTLVVGPSQRWHGPGHNAVYHEPGKDWLVYHAYDAEDHGHAKLRIDALRWDEAGWPRIASDVSR